MTVAVVAIRTTQLTALQEWRLENGGADAVLYSEDREGAPFTAASLPPGTRLVSYQSDYRLISTAGGRRVSAEVSNLALSDPLIAATSDIAGRVPSQASEVLLSPMTAKALKVGIGGSVDLDRPLDATVTVVGIGGRGFNNLLLLHPDARFPVRPGGGTESRVIRLVDLSDQLTPAQVQEWANRSGARMAPGLVPPGPFDYPAEDQSAPVRWSWFAGAVVLTVTGIVIASAFATGARRQLTTLGQLSANGASPSAVRRVLMLQGTWTGVAGAALGLAIGAAALAVLAPHRDRFLGQRFPSYDVRWVDLVPIVVMGIAAATVAALVPARSASRIPVLAALAGRRPLAAVPRWLTVTGVAVSAGGLALLALATLGSTAGDASGGGDNVWTVTGIAGGIALLLGVCAVAPGYVSVLGPAAARLGGSWRLAARSLARQRSRTGAVVSAVCVTGALAVALSAIIQSVETGSRQTEIPADRVVISTSAHTGPLAPENGPVTETILSPPAAVVDRVKGVLPRATVLQQSWVGLTQAGDQTAGVADADLLDTYGFGWDVRSALERTGLVSLGSNAGTTTLTIEAGGRPPATVPAAVVAIDNLGSIGQLPPVLITPGKAAELGLTPKPGDVVLRLPADLTADQRNAVEGVFEEQIDEQSGEVGPDGTPPPFTNINFYRPYGAPDPFVVDTVLGGVALVFALFVVATSLALAAAETRDERDVLTVVGASPRTIRRTSGVKAVVVSLLGTALAVPLGLLPVLVFTSVETADLPFVFPWRVVALLVVAVPLIAGATTLSASALALRVRPVRTSTMAFE